MAKSFFHNVTDRIIGGSSKTTDVQILQAIDHFEDEHSKLVKFKREFDKYTQAILVFDNASYRFFGFMGSLTDSTWSQQPFLIQSCNDIGRIRGEHLQQLHKQINSNIDISLNTFETMKIRINEQNCIQRDYDKTRKQYQTNLKSIDQAKVDRIKNELDQLKSLLNLTNRELRDVLPKFHIDLQNEYKKTLMELFDIHGKYNKNFHKLCSNFIKRVRGETFNISNDSKEETPSSSVASDDKKTPYSTPLSQPKQTNYKVLHQARVTHDYKAENEDEIDLVKDEFISVIAFLNDDDNAHDEGWAFAEKSDETTGLFPVNFAIRLYDNEGKQQ